MNNNYANNIQRAAGTARFICGHVASIKRGFRSSWALDVQTQHGLYPISVWDDGKALTDKVLSFAKNQIVSLQVHHYENDDYNPWKVWDVLEFDSYKLSTINSLENSIKQHALQCSSSSNQCEIETREINEHTSALAAQIAEQDTRNIWQTIAGISTALGAFAAAPMTGGGSLLSLPMSAMLIHSGTAAKEHETTAQVALRHRRERLGRLFNFVREEALKALQLTHQLEAVVDSAKMQPWKKASRNAAYGILPPQLTAELHAYAQMQQATQTIDVTCTSEPWFKVHHLSGKRYTMAAQLDR